VAAIVTYLSKSRGMWNILDSHIYVVLRCNRGCVASLTIIPSVIQCAVYLSQREIDYLEKGDRAGGVIASRFIFVESWKHEHVM